MFFGNSTVRMRCWRRRHIVKSFHFDAKLRDHHLQIADVIPVKALNFGICDDYFTISAC